MNPFEDEIEDMNICKGVENCPRLIADFRRFSNAPPPLPLKQVRGSVVLVAGCAGHGKSVYGHRLLHEYQAQGLAPFELLAEGPFQECLARRKQVLLKMRSKAGVLDAEDTDTAGTELDDARWASGLRAVMSQAGGDMVVRLPGIMPNASDAQATGIAWEVLQYAMAAHQSKSVFIYEYNAKDWPGDWEVLRTEIERNRDAKVRTRVLKPFSPDDLWTYAKGVIDGSPHKQITLGESVGGWLKHLFGEHSLRPENVHRLMRRIFDNAIADDSTTVTLEHLMPEAVQLGSEAA